MAKPVVLAICGSTRFIEPIAAMAWTYEKEGVITLFPLLLPPQVARTSHQAEIDGVKERIDELFLRKIDLADAVLVMDVFGYIGESTHREAAYAEGRVIPRRYFSRDADLQRRIAPAFPEIAAACVERRPSHAARCDLSRPLVFESFCPGCGGKVVCADCRSLATCCCA